MWLVDDMNLDLIWLFEIDMIKMFIARYMISYLFYNMFLFKN